MQSVFLEGKTYEILTLFLQQFTEKRNEPDDLKLLRKSTITKIEAAVDIIKKELDIRISVNALAKRVGLNRNTLQAGFKQLFSTSVNEYMRDHKIERAKVLLENSDLNITEITYKIGINSEAISQNYLKNATD
ncbi:helix-turn-helix domain-containing protein [Lacinutrix neustonica]